MNNKWKWLVLVHSAKPRGGGKWSSALIQTRFLSNTAFPFLLLCIPAQVTWFCLLRQNLKPALMACASVQGRRCAHLHSLQRWVPKDCIKETVWQTERNTSNYSIPVLKTWNAHGQRQTLQNIHSKMCISVIWTAPAGEGLEDWQKEGTNKQKKVTCRGAHLAVLDIIVFQPILAVVVRYGVPYDNILHIAVGLNRAWTGWSPEVTTPRSSGQ